MKERMGDNFVDVNWPDCNHVSYKKHKAEIQNKIKQFIKTNLGFR